MNNIDIGQISNTIINIASTYGLKIIGAIAILIAGRIVVNWITGLTRKALKKSISDPTLERFLDSIVRILLRVVVYLAAVSTLGVQTASFIAILGAAGLAVGLSLQGTLANFASGVMITLFKSLRAGDYVEAGGTSGTVEEVGIFNTLIKTPDNKLIIVPNSNITGNNIINYSAKDTRRVDMVFGIGYDDDLLKAKNILMDLLKQDERILEDPTPVVVVSALADSSVNFNVRPWVKTDDYWPVYWDLQEAVKLTFDREGISIPYPQRDLHVYQQPDSGTTT